MTISTTSSKLLVRLQPNSGLIVQHYKPEYPAEKNWITAFKVKVTPKVKNVSEYMSGCYLLNHKTFCTKLGMVMLQNEPECHAKQFCCCCCLLSSRSRSQRGLILSKYYTDYDIFWTADSLATKLGPMIGYYRPERLMEKLDYCIQGQCHSEG